MDFCQGMFDFNGAFVTPGVAFAEEHSAGSLRVAPATCRRRLAAVSAYLRTLDG